MNVLYFTNKDIDDWDVIPDIIRSTGDNVITYTNKIDLEYIINNKIDFIVSDRARYLIKNDVIQYLEKKIVNLHPSYLPWNRGYHPNYWSIKEGTPHGVTVHFIDEGIDTGDILVQTRVWYSDNETLRVAYDRLRRLMVGLFKVCWLEIRETRMKGIKQSYDEGNLHYKADFEGCFDNLIKGWDTKIKHVK